MYGTRDELCMALTRMFTPDEPLALLVWTEEGIDTACRVQAPTEEEVRCLLAVIGNTPMDVYREEGVSNATVSDLLQRHREAARRQVVVPAGVLSRLLACLERELTAREGEAWDAGRDVPEHITRTRQDMQALQQRLAA